MNCFICNAAGNKEFKFAIISTSTHQRLLSSSTSYYYQKVSDVTVSICDDCCNKERTKLSKNNRILATSGALVLIVSSVFMWIYRKTDFWATGCFGLIVGLPLLGCGADKFDMLAFCRKHVKENYAGKTAKVLTENEWEAVKSGKVPGYSL